MTMTEDRVRAIVREEMAAMREEPDAGDDDLVPCVDCSTMVAPENAETHCEGMPWAASAPSGEVATTTRELLDDLRGPPAGDWPCDKCRQSPSRHVDAGHGFYSREQQREWNDRLWAAVGNMAAERERLAADNARLTMLHDAANRARIGIGEELDTLRTRLDAAERDDGYAHLVRRIHEVTGIREAIAIDCVIRVTEQRDAALRDLATARAEAERMRGEAMSPAEVRDQLRVARQFAFEEAARAIDNWPHVAAIVRALAAKGGA